MFIQSWDAVREDRMDIGKTMLEERGYSYWSNHIKPSTTSKLENINGAVNYLVLNMDGLVNGHTKYYIPHLTGQTVQMLLIELGAGLELRAGVSHCPRYLERLWAKTVLVYPAADVIIVKMLNADVYNYIEA